MVNNTLKGICVIVGLVFMYGCTTSGVEVRRYVDVRERVDQNMDEGNAGYIAGDPQPEDRSDIRKTRKIYVVEVTDTEIPVPEGTAVIEESDQVDMADGAYAMDDLSSESMNSNNFSSDNYIEVSRDDTLQPYDDYRREEFEISGPMVTEATEYTIRKDDTLQKISKQFYNTYSQWPRIYEANKDVIDNPDRIKPGTVIKIPAL